MVRQRHVGQSRVVQALVNHVLLMRERCQKAERQLQEVEDVTLHSRPHGSQACTATQGGDALCRMHAINWLPKVGCIRSDMYQALPDMYGLTCTRVNAKHESHILDVA